MTKPLKHSRPNEPSSIRVAATNVTLNHFLGPRPKPPKPKPGIELNQAQSSAGTDIVERTPRSSGGLSIGAPSNETCVVIDLTEDSVEEQPDTVSGDAIQSGAGSSTQVVDDSIIVSGIGSTSESDIAVEDDPKIKEEKTKTTIKSTLDGQDHNGISVSASNIGVRLPVTVAATVMAADTEFLQATTAQATPVQTTPCPMTPVQTMAVQPTPVQPTPIQTPPVQEMSVSIEQVPKEGEKTQAIATVPSTVEE